MVEYDISYEFGSPQEIILRGIQYALKDKRRLLRGGLYALYLWIFFCRFLHMIQSTAKVAGKLFKNFIRNFNVQS